MNVLLVPAHPGFPGQIPQSRKTVVCVLCVLAELKHPMGITVGLLRSMSSAPHSAIAEHIANSCRQLAEQTCHYALETTPPEKPAFTNVEHKCKLTFPIS